MKCGPEVYQIHNWKGLSSPLLSIVIARIFFLHHNELAWELKTDGTQTSLWDFALL